MHRLLVFLTPFLIDLSWSIFGMSHNTEINFHSCAHDQSSYSPDGTGTFLRTTRQTHWLWRTVALQSSQCIINQFGLFSDRITRCGPGHLREICSIG